MTAAVRKSSDRAESAPAFWTSSVAIGWRGWIRIRRMPSIIVQSVSFPAFFLLFYTGLYGAVTALPGFPTDEVTNWYLPFMLFQGAAFGGLGAGFNTALDIENGFFDRLLLMPGRRISIMVGSVGYSLIRSMLTVVVVSVVGVLLGASPTDWVGIPLLLLALISVSIMGSLYSLALTYRLKDQRVAPLFPIGVFVLLFMSNAQVPISITTGWLHQVARINPISNILRLGRQGFLDSGVTWEDTWGGLVAIVVCTGLLAWWAERGLRKMNA